jgi:hypothetical protein
MRKLLKKRVNLHIGEEILPVMRGDFPKCGRDKVINGLSGANVFFSCSRGFAFQGFLSRASEVSFTVKRGTFFCKKTGENLSC